MKAEHGVAILYDCHSIRSVVPFLFEGTLPDFNIGTNDGNSCAPAIEQATRDVCAGAAGYTHVVNGRFKGGWTTRHYGRPRDSVHAIQMELTQATHLESETLPFAYSVQKAPRLQVYLRAILGHWRVADELGGEMSAFACLPSLLSPCLPGPTKW